MPNMIKNAQLERWIKAIGRGDRDALARLYDAAGPAVYAYALSILKHRDDAEDILHESFLSVCHAAQDYRPQGKPMAWLMTITRNHCFKLLQRQKRYLPLEAQDRFCQPETDPDDRLLIQGCMNVLTDEERQIVILHAVAGCKHRQIGEMLQLKTSTVLSKYRRAIQKLKKEL